MFKIGEFSKLTQVSVRMLRYYEKAGLLKPAEIDHFTGYRYYTASQIPFLNKIVYLRDSGFTVAEIASALDNWREDILLTKLEEKKQEIRANIEAEKKRNWLSSKWRRMVCLGKRNRCTTRSASNPSPAIRFFPCAESSPIITPKEICGWSLPLLPAKKQRGSLL